MNQILKEMLRTGQNPEEAKLKVIKHYKTVRRLYPEESNKKMAEIITVFALNN